MIKKRLSAVANAARYAKIKTNFVQEAHGFRVGGLVHSHKPVLAGDKSIGTGPFVVHTLYSTTGRMTLKYSPGGKIIRDGDYFYHNSALSFYHKDLYPDKFMDRIHEIHNKEKEIAATP